MPRLRALLVAGAGVLATAGPSAAAAPLRPAADAGVTAARPRRNLGTETRLVVARRPAQRAYVRFAPGPAPAAGARVVLHLYPLRTSRGGLLLRHASERPWDERAISFRTRPRTGPRMVATGPLVRRRWARIDITQLVTRSGVVSLELAAARDRVDVASREFGPATAPKLTIEAPGAVPRPGHVVLPPPLPGQLPPPGRPVPVDPARPCGVAPSAPRWEHVVWIVMENKAYSRIIAAPDAPYLNALAAACGSASSFFATARPSLPNYIAMTSGDTFGITDNNGPLSHPLAGESIFSQLGGDWRALQESMPANCATASGGMYAARHNPATYFTNVAGACQTQNVALADPPDLSARFTFVTPNLCNGMHDCGVPAGDLWLSQWVPKILATPQYRAGTTAVFITWDEDDGSAAQQIPTLVVAPSVPSGTGDATRYDHYSMLRTTEEMLGLPLLGQAGASLSMRAGLHL